MLKIHYINVANGDSILIEHITPENTHRYLVDTGRPIQEKAEGSKSCTCLEYLNALNISHLDALFITHLHVDHFGGLTNILPSGITFDRAYASYFPTHPENHGCVENEIQKTVIGLIGCLNYWADDTAMLQQANTELHELTAASTTLDLDGLSVNVLAPNEMSIQIQNTVYEHIFANDPLPFDVKYWAAKARNPNSLRLELQYAGRRIILAGDCYGEVWEQNESHCDILKVPHHADAKAMTAKLAKSLSPDWAVISCSAIYNPKKDRPSRNVHELLKKLGSTIYYTDCFSSENITPLYHSAIISVISPDGSIHWEQNDITSTI